ncbi:MAG TPA: HEAT repeat domain-containing protein [Polyangia bacterium]|nr:HEAT repeat domain-containing protein [Polyangia bacterium]
MPAVVLIGIVVAGALAAPPQVASANAAAAKDAAAAWLSGVDDPTRDLGARDAGERLRAVLELARLDGARATALLVPMLADRDANVRLAAARLLARRGGKQATEVAVAWLATRAPQDQVLGLLVLRQVADLTPEARRAAERALRDGDLPSRLQALDVLTAHPAARSFGAVAGALDDELAEVRARAAHALAAARDPRASVPLLAHVADSDRGVREATLGALGDLGDRRVLPALLRQLADGAPEPRGEAVDALARLGDAGAVPALIGLARRRPRDETARRAAFALGVLATPEAVDALLTLAREPPGADDVRLALERAGAAAVPRLCRELATGTPTSARLAAEALGRIGDRRATAALAAAATSGRIAALEALARLADPAAVPALARLAERGEIAELRALALEALTATDDDGAAQVLPLALADGDAGVRARAVGLAARLGARAPADAVAQRLADPDPEVRKAAALTLGRAPALPRDSAREILAALAPAAPRLTDAAAASLGDALERLAREPAALGPVYLASVEPRARAVLARALAAAGTPPSRDVATSLIRDLSGDDALARAAADALARAALTRDQQQALAVAFARASEDVAARLAPAMARFPAGAAALDALVADDGAPPSVRAGSTWALSSARGPATWTAVRLTDATGAPWPAHWVSVTAKGGAVARALTDLDGRAVFVGVPEGATLTVPPE